MKISSPNLEKVVGQLKALVSGIPIAAKQSSKIIATELLRRSLTMSPKVPEDSGALKSTGRVEAVKEGYAVTFGGPVSGTFVRHDGRVVTYVDYAGYVHDDLRPRKYTVSGSGPKFVEEHFIAMADDAPKRISETMQELADSIITEGR